MPFSSANNHEPPSGAARFLLAAVVSGFVLLFLCLLMPITISQIGKVLPPLVLLPCILLATSCVLWLQAYFLPMLTPQRNVRRRMSEPNFNAVGEEMRTMRRLATGPQSPGSSLRDVTRLQKACLLGASFIFACIVWMFVVSMLLQPQMQDYVTDKGLARVPRALAKAQMAAWSDPAARSVQLTYLRRMNPEWDFMSRTFLVLALANVSLRDPTLKPAALDVIDTILTETLDQERRQGQEVFFIANQRMHRKEFVNPSKRSIFVDGEIAMMLAARRLVEEHPQWKNEMQERVRLIAQEMAEGPVLCGESYPNECWIFCNSIALATLRISDVLDGTDHSTFIREWIGRARTSLIDSKTNILVSRFDFSAKPKVSEGPEGSSIWTTTHFLYVVDETFARDQYNSAARQLRGNLLGFGYAREWPSASDYARQEDIDSAHIIPFIQASPGSSGEALLAAQTFADTRWLKQLITSLDFVGFPTEKEGRLRYLSSNALGDAVMLYAFVQGPLWEKVRNASPLPPSPMRAPKVSPPPTPSTPPATDPGKAAAPAPTPPVKPPVPPVPDPAPLTVPSPSLDQMPAPMPRTPVSEPVPPTPDSTRTTL